MLKHIIGTFGTKIACVFIAFVILMINSHSFHAEGLGVISLFVLDVSIIHILSFVFGSGSLVYSFVQFDKFQVLLVSYISTVIVAVAGSCTMCYFQLGVPFAMLPYLLLATLSVSVYFLNTQLFLAKDNILYYNLFQLLPSIVLLVLLLVFVFVLGQDNCYAYIRAYTVCYVCFAAITLVPAMKGVRYTGMSGFWGVCKQMLKYGFTIQVANLSQMLNYRLGFYFGEYCTGTQGVGLLSVGTKVSESVWILPNSLAPVQYAKIANHQADKAYATSLTLSFAKMTFMVSAVLIVLLLLLPSVCFAWIFGEEFRQIQPLLYVIAPGILFFSVNIMVAHYFSGFGKYYINTICSLLGLAVTAVAGACFIPLLKTLPMSDAITILAAINSASYMVSCTATMVFFFRDTHISWRRFLFNRQDVQIARSEIKTLLQSFKHTKTDIE